MAAYTPVMKRFMVVFGRLVIVLVVVVGGWFAWRAWALEPVPEGCVPFEDAPALSTEPDGRVVFSDQFVEINGEDYWCLDWSWVGD